MGILEIIKLVLQIFLSVWQDRTDPEKAKTRAAAKITKEFNTDEQSFDKALAVNDAEAISEHFEQLRKRIQVATAGAKKDA